jgi:hypothetical protein
MRIWPIVRDVIFVWLLTGIGGFIISVAVTVVTGGPPKHTPGYILAIGTSNFLLGAAAFTIVGCLTRKAKWRHLAIVAVVAWLTSLINVVLFGTRISQWAAGIIFMAVIMGIGGGLSNLFKASDKSVAL